MFNLFPSSVVLCDSPSRNSYTDTVDLPDPVAGLGCPLIRPALLDLGVFVTKIRHDSDLRLEYIKSTNVLSTNCGYDGVCEKIFTSRAVLVCRQAGQCPLQLQSQRKPHFDWARLAPRLYYARRFDYSVRDRNL